MNRWIFGLACLFGLSTTVIGDESARQVDVLARDYVVLELAMGEHDPGHVDAYFGPPELKAQAVSAGWTTAEIAERAHALQSELGQVSSGDGARITELDRRLTALLTRVAIHQGETLTFDEESERLFAAQAPDYDAAWFDAVLEQIDNLLPGDAPLATRVNDFKDQFTIPEDKLDVVFRRALDECRQRTRAHIELPAEESFRVEYVTDKPWSGYNWYEGSAVSLIQVNTDLPTAIDRAVDLGCHEGYPGHHVYNATLERKLFKGRGWLEYSIYPLFSPQSLIAEGSANYGKRLAFPGDERVIFEREVLFPLAGLDASEADRYYTLQALLAKLSYAGNEAARDYLNKRISREEAVDWLVRYALYSPERAAQRMRFVDTYRSYVINYNLGQDLVAEYVERGEADVETRWHRFERILSEPISAPELIGND